MSPRLEALRARLTQLWHDITHWRERHVYLESNRRLHRYRHRGVVARKQDAEAFVAVMRRRGHGVKVYRLYRGEEI